MFLISTLLFCCCAFAAMWIMLDGIPSAFVSSFISVRLIVLSIGAVERCTINFFVWILEICVWGVCGIICIGIMILLVVG